MHIEGQPGLIKTTSQARGRISGDGGVELAFGYWLGRGDPVVAIHGLTASHLNYIGIAERLAGRRPLFGLDLRGRGDSDKPSSGYGMEQHGRDVAAAIQTLELGPSVIVGHSMGAFVATALAVQNPELVSGIVMIDGGFTPDLPLETGSPVMLDATLAARIEQLNRTFDSKEAYQNFWRAQPNFPPADWNSWTEASLDYEFGDASKQPKASAEAVGIDIIKILQHEETINRLKSLRVPILLIRAELGMEPSQPPILPDSMLEQFRACVPQMKEETVPGTTHFTIMLGERGASRVADLIVEFADSCEQSKSGKEQKQQ